MENKQKTY